MCEGASEWVDTRVRINGMVDSVRFEADLN